MHGSNKPFHNVLLHIHLCIVQERLLKMLVLALDFPGAGIGHQLESLILAQNERWRHA